MWSVEIRIGLSRSSPPILVTGFFLAPKKVFTTTILYDEHQAKSAEHIALPG